MRFPGPFVTSVGSTTGINPETAIYFSGGGFSNYFPTPPYQTKDVTAYIAKLGGTYSGLYKCGFCLLASREPLLNSMVDYHIYSANGRGIPDVAARGDRYRVILGGETKYVGGTSASAPVRRLRDTSFRFVQLTFIRSALDCRRIGFTLKRLQDLARSPFPRVPQPILVLQGFRWHG